MYSVTDRKRYRELDDGEFLQFPYIRSSVLEAWFYIDFTVHRHGLEWSERMMIPKWDDLKSILVSSRGDMNIVNIYYVTPPALNRSNSWKMEKVLKISEFIDSTGELMQTFVVSSEHIYGGESSTSSLGSSLPLYLKEGC